MEHYKSWGGLNSQLKGFLCDDLKNRITYFLTRYHKVHDAYGRASICLDKKDLVNFSWAEMCRQDMDMGIAYDKDPFLSDDEVHAQLKPKWDAQATYHEMDFLDAALTFRSMAISNALESENYIIKIRFSHKLKYLIYRRLWTGVLDKELCGRLQRKVLIGSIQSG